MAADAASRMAHCMRSLRATQCPICLATEFIPVVQRDAVPVFQNVLFKYRTDALNVERASLQIQACAACGFIFNAAFEPAKATYARGYDNNQTHSAQFTGYLDGHIRHLVHEVGIRDCTIVEVGSGNGWFLERLVRAAPRSQGIGFDPAYSGPEYALDGRVRYVPRYFQPEDAVLRAEVIVCRHVIEHIAHPLALLRSVRAAILQTDNARVFFETPSVTWILRNEVFWDFFYEHCSYFSDESLRSAFNRAGFAVSRVNHVFGGQYLWFEALPEVAENTELDDPGEILGLAGSFARAEPRERERWLDQIHALRSKGKVAIWGAGAKGVTFLNLLDPDGSTIDCVVDVSPDKQGRFVGGTGHPVVGVEQLGERGIISAILMNPNYRDENLRLLREVNTTIALV